MSEADSLNDQPAPVPINPPEQMATVHSADSEGLHSAQDDGWQTVDFPGAVSVDALPHSQTDAFNASSQTGIIHYSSAEIDPSATYMAAIALESEAVTQLQQLQDENATLRDRLAQVELDLVQQQIERQLESACTLAQAEAATDGTTMPTLPVLGPPALQLTHDRMHQLLQELERSHQTAQRQQILVETLAEQLESSQERIAQLERDCALTQQRHNEQVQQVLQAESACRDLRLRLHRQQQQTLQFKAALEKCLEMPALYGNQALADVALADSAAAPDALSALLKPKNQPVKPWSLPSSTAQTTTSEQLEQPKPLFQQDNETDLFQGDGALVARLDTPFSDDGQANAMADPSALLDSDDPQFVTHLMHLIFPGTPKRLSVTTTDDLQADISQTEAVFDLSPFLEKRDNLAALPSVELSNQASSLDGAIESLTTLPKTTEADHQAEVDAVPSDAGAIAHIPASTLPHDHSNDPLWRDLATLIELPLPVADPDAVASVTVNSSDASVEPVQAATDTTGIPPLFTAPYEAAVETASVEVAGVTPIDPPSPPLTTWTWRDRLSSKNNPSPTPITERAFTERAATGMPQSPSKLLALSAGSKQASVKQQTVSVSSQAELTSTPFAPSTPSPIVYPLRSTKKLASLAAVDLPTFPRR